MLLPSPLGGTARNQKYVRLTAQSPVWSEHTENRSIPVGGRSIRASLTLIKYVYTWRSKLCWNCWVVTISATSPASVRAMEWCEPHWPALVTVPQLQTQSPPDCGHLQLVNTKISQCVRIRTLWPAKCFIYTVGGRSNRNLTSVSGTRDK